MIWTVLMTLPVLLGPAWIWQVCSFKTCLSLFLPCLVDNPLQIRLGINIKNRPFWVPILSVYPIFVLISLRIRCVLDFIGRTPLVYLLDRCAPLSIYSDLEFGPSKYFTVDVSRYLYFPSKIKFLEKNCNNWILFLSLFSHD